MLNRFETVKKEEIKNLRALKARGAFPKPLAMKRPSFRDALVPRDGLPAVIAEYKRASPSRGLICDTISVEDTVSAYAENGASALSSLRKSISTANSDSWPGQGSASMPADLQPPSCARTSSWIPCRWK